MKLFTADDELNYYEMFYIYTNLFHIILQGPDCRGRLFGDTDFKPSLATDDETPKVNIVSFLFTVSLKKKQCIFFTQTKIIIKSCHFNLCVCVYIYKYFIGNYRGQANLSSKVNGFYFIFKLQFSLTKNF